MDFTYGQKAVGVHFNMDELEEVDVIKHTAAQLIDLLLPIRDAGGPAGRAAAIAMTEFEGAAMWAVKAAVLSSQQPDPLR